MRTHVCPDQAGPPPATIVTTSNAGTRAASAAGALNAPASWLEDWTDRAPSVILVAPAGRKVGLGWQRSSLQAGCDVDEPTTLVERARDGSLEAYGDLVRRFQDMAYGFAYAWLGDWHLAQDAAQEAFVEAFRDLAKLREPAAFPGWLRRIVRKHCDRLTRRKRVATVPLEAAAAVPADEPTPPEAAARREMAERVLAALRGLPDDQRMVTTLFYIDGYSQQDIADFLDVPVTTVKKRLAHSRERLRDRMMTMVDASLKSHPLPDRFADVVVQVHFVAERIAPLADTMRALTDEEMLAKGAELRRRLADGEPRDAALAEAFALVREATRRAWNTPHYDIQLVAALILDQGWVAEEATGEGKTLTCFPAACMAALEGMRVHVVTVNDYLAGRDADLARPVLERLGLTVGHVAQGMGAVERRRAYRCDITYASNCELGFDLLRDQLRPADDEPVQGPLDLAILDEADSILIDEARTPLIISGPADADPAVCARADAVARGLIACGEAGEQLFGTRDSYDVELTPAGLAAVAESAGSDEPQWPTRVRQALRARLLYRRDREYIVQDGRVVLIDEATGRPQPGRKWSEGLHQAIECKEGVAVTPERRELARITFKAFFSRYRKLAGLTGTAKPQAYHFRERYGLEVAAVPTRLHVHRVDHLDRIYPDAEARLAAIVEEIHHVSRDLGRPVLVGIRTIEQSEALSALLAGEGVEHEVLNARRENRAREAEIVAAAGQQRPFDDGSGTLAGAVTIATNMAGRGTDIALGPGVVCETCRAPSPERLAALDVEPDPAFPPGAVKCCIACPEHDAATACGHCFKPKLDPAFPRRGRTACRDEPPCGLHVVGAERQESRRMDDQLRARAGVQGAPGSSRFFLSLDDPLFDAAPAELRERCRRLLDSQPFIEDAAIAEAVARVQQQAERRLFETSRRCDAARRE